MIVFPRSLVAAFAGRLQWGDIPVPPPEAPAVQPEEPPTPDEQPAVVNAEPEEPPVRFRPQSGTLITMFGAAAREQPHANIERAIAHLDGIERGVGCPFCREVRE